MSDPAVAAAERAWAGHTVDCMAIRRPPWILSVDSARELAKSVQELHHKYRLYELAIESCWDYEHDMFEDASGEMCCKTCTGDDEEYACAHCANYDGNNLWPCETAKRVYPSEELGL